MIEIIKISKLIEPSLLEKTTLDSEGKLPIFGVQSERISDALYQRGLRKNKYLLFIKDSYCELTEFYSRVGIYAAKTVQERGVFYEVGCGLAIPSLACARTNNIPVIAVDKNYGEIKRARQLAGALNLPNIVFEKRDAKDIIWEIGSLSIFPPVRYRARKLNANDSLLIVNPTDDKLDHLLLHSEVKNLIFIGGPGKLFGRHEVFTSQTSTPDLWYKWIKEQSLEECWYSCGWKNALLSGEWEKAFMPGMALLHLSRD